MTLVGKGYFIWKIPQCDGGVPAAIAARASAAGLSHVLIKIADGANWMYNYDYETRTDLIPPVADALRATGISVWGWHYVRGDNPTGEARLAVDRMRALRLDGYVIDAEGEYRHTEKRGAAKNFMDALRSGLPSTPIALSSYRFPRIHQPLPWTEFLERCDLAMPQVYFEGAHNPEQQLALSVEQYAALRPARPFVPTIPTYASSKWRPTPDEIVRILRKARELGLTAANAWSWDFASRPAFADLWNAVASYDWPPATPLGDVPERLVDALNKQEPESVAGLYAENAAHVTGSRTLVGKGAIQDWYRKLLTELLPESHFELTGKNGSDNSRHFTWTASGPRGSVRDGSDTVGLRDGRIQYHYSHFSVA
jgi:hypothetical protein